jgi:hypothetical protein
LTDRVDIFDVATGKRTTSKLPSGARGYITAVATKDFVFFAAGLKKAAYTLNVDIIYQDTSNAVDVYHVKSGEWRKLTLAGGASMWATGVAVSTRLDLRLRRAQLHRPARRSLGHRRREFGLFRVALRSSVLRRFVLCLNWRCWYARNTSAIKEKQKKGKTKRVKRTKRCTSSSHWLSPPARPALVRHRSHDRRQCAV